MKHRMLGLAVLSLTVWSLTALAADKGNKGNNKVDNTKQVNSDNLNPQDYTGKLISTPGSSGDFVIRVDYQHPDPKAANAPKGYNNNHNIAHQQQQLAQAQQHLAQAKTPQQAQQAMQRVQQAQAAMQNAMMQAQMRGAANVKMITDHIDIDFHLSPTAIVRNMNVPQAFDDKGNVKKYTNEELKALKGKNPNLIGYEADASALQPNMVVKVTLRKKPVSPTTPAKKPEPAKPDAPGADKDVEEIKNTVNNNKTWVTMVVIQSDPDAAVDNTKPNPKKNK